MLVVAPSQQKAACITHCCVHFVCFALCLFFMQSVRVTRTPVLQDLALHSASHKLLCTHTFVYVYALLRVLQLHGSLSPSVSRDLTALIVCLV